MTELYSGDESAMAAGGQAELATGFLNELRRASFLLRAQRQLRVSLFRFHVTGLPLPTAMHIVEHSLKPQGFVGVLPDGAIGFLYLGPRGNRAVADLALVHHIRALVQGELRRQVCFSPVMLAGFNVLHVWADEIIDPSDLIDRLCGAAHGETLKAS